MSREEKRIVAVIFDLDDTLLDWSQPSLSWEEFTRPMANNVYDHLVADGHDLPDRKHFMEQLGQQVQQVWTEAKQDWSGAYFGDALRRTVLSYGIDAEAMDLRELMEVYDWRPMPGVELFDDVHDVLEALRQAGYKLGLITNSFLPMWMRDVELRHYDLIDYFYARITSGDTGYMKPHPAIYERMLELLNTPAHRAIFVGDRPRNDIAGANEAGLISVLMDPPHLERELDGVVPDFTISRLSELMPILEGLEEMEREQEQEIEIE